MTRLTALFAFTLLALGFLPLAEARSSYSAAECKTDDRAAGTIVGALVGAAAGGAIGSHSDGYRYSHRYSRGYSRYNRGHHYRGYRADRRSYNRHGTRYHGQRGDRHHRGYRQSHYRGHKGDGTLVGIFAGALIGGIIGNELAASASDDCARRRVHQPYKPYYSSDTQYSNYAQNDPRQAGQSVYGHRVEPAYTYAQPRQAEGAYAARQSNQNMQPISDGQIYSDDLYVSDQLEFEPQCTMVNKLTYLPDGKRLYEPEKVCQYSAGGKWIKAN